MYGLYAKSQTPQGTAYAYEKRACLYGCNAGFIPWLLKRSLKPRDSQPLRWHIPVEAALGTNGYAGKTLIIDLKPKRHEDNISLYELLDVWGYSDRGWTPLLLHLRGLFVDAPPDTCDRQRFVLDLSSVSTPIYSVTYVVGSVSDGTITGKWVPPPPSSTNGALLWPEALQYFVSCVRERTPEVLTQVR